MHGIILPDMIKTLITSASEVMFSSLFCLLTTLHKNFQTDLHEFSGKAV